jgi:nicotinamidase-related amidase
VLPERSIVTNKDAGQCERPCRSDASAREYSTIDALADGYEVYIVTDAAGGGSTERHERGVQRMVQAGAQPLTTIAYVSELQRDWARPTADDVAKLFAEHGGGFGQGLRWEWQLLALKEGTR